MRPAATVLLILGWSVSVSMPAVAALRHDWSRLIDGPNSDAVRTFAVRPGGDIFMIADTNMPGTPVGLGVFRLESTGELLSARPLYISRTSGVLAFGSAATTPDGGFVLAGSFSGTIDFGLTPLVAVSRDAFVLGFDDAGAPIWQRRHGGNGEETGHAVAVSEHGDILLAGSSRDFAGDSNAFLVSLDAGGEPLWSRVFGGTGVQEGLAVDCGPDGGVVLACRQNGGTTFGGAFLNAAGGDDAAIAAFDSTGAHRWSRQLGNKFTQLPADVAVDVSGNVFLGGVSRAALDVGGATLLPPAPDATYGFVVSYDARGAHRWSCVVEDTVHSAVHRLDTDRSGNCFAIATHEGLADVGDELLGEAAFLLIGYDATGHVIHARGHGQLTHVVPRIGIDALGRVYLAGTTREPIDLGGGVLVPAGDGIVLGRFSPWRPPDIAISDFGARLMADGIEIRWSVRSGEPLGGYALRRRVGGSPSFAVLDFGAATAGEYAFVDRAMQPGRVHTYELVVTNAFGDEVVSPLASVKVPVFATVLYQNAPNPFNPATTITYSLAEPATVAITIHDVSGKRVARLEQGPRTAGTHEAQWDGRNGAGARLPGGVYFYRLDGLPGGGARKMVLLN